MSHLAVIAANCRFLGQLIFGFFSMLKWAIMVKGNVCVVFFLHSTDNFFTSVLYYLKVCVRFIIGYICAALLEINFDMR